MFFNTRAKKDQAKLKRLLAEMQSEKQQLRDHLDARFAEVDRKNAILDQSRSRLENLLKESLLVDTCIIFDSLKIQARLPEFERKEPILQLPAPPSGIACWLPWKNRSYEKACASAERNYQKDLVVYREALFNHKNRVSQIRAEAEKHNQDIERFLQDFVAGEAGAVVRYFKLVLKNSEYPPGFSKKAELAYFPESRLLKISYDLPAMDIIPETKAYKYAKSRDEIAGIVLPQKQRRQFYASVLAQTSLRTIYEIFAADRTEKIEHIVFEGYVDAINPGTGQPGRFCLIALNIRREHFLNLNLQQVEPVACLKGLNARVSSKPDLLLSVSSSSGEERDDAQGPAVSDADMLQALNIRIGELDDEIQEQKKRNVELENELSDKRDRIAELIRDLREEQERSAVLSAAIHAQKDDTVELRAGASEEPVDAQPAKTVAAEDSTSRDSAAAPPAKPAWFHQIRTETPPDEPAGTPVPPRRPDPETALLLEAMSVIIEEEKEYVDYIGAGLPKAAINRLTQDGKLERNKFHTYKLRVTPAGKAWYDEQLCLQGAPEPESVSTTAEAESKVDKTVRLGDLLGGGRDNADDSQADEATAAVCQTDELLQRPDGTPDDLLTDLHELATIMGAHGSDTAQVIETMVANNWQCSHETLEAIFRQTENVTFVSTIIDEINERALDEIDHPLIVEDKDQWIIEDEFRDEIEHILKHPEYLNHF